MNLTIAQEALMVRFFIRKNTVGRVYASDNLGTNEAPSKAAKVLSSKGLLTFRESQGLVMWNYRTTRAGDAWLKAYLASTPEVAS